MSAWKPILAALVIFAAGVATGGLTVSLRRHPVPETARTPGELRAWTAQRWDGQLRELARRMERQLDLSPVQRERIEVIVRESQQRMKSMAEEMAPRTREEIRQMRQRIHDELRPEQRSRFEELFREREEWRKRGERGGKPKDTSDRDR